MGPFSFEVRMIHLHVESNLVDLLESGEVDGIIHLCNCYHLMNNGISAEIAKRYPVALEVDKKTTELGDWSKMGEYSVAKTVHGPIINAYTFYRSESSTSKPAFIAVFLMILTQLNQKYPNKTFGIKKLPDAIWNDVVDKIQQVTPKLKLVVAY